MPLAWPAWSQRLWHGLHASRTTPFLLLTFFFISGVFCAFSVFCNFDFGVLLRLSSWPKNTPDGLKWGRYVLAMSPIKGGQGANPPKNWSNFLKTPQRKTETQISPEFPKIEKLFWFFPNILVICSFFYQYGSNVGPRKWPKLYEIQRSYVTLCTAPYWDIPIICYVILTPYFNTEWTTLDRT